MKILMRATNWVGDAVMAIPALEAIRVRWAAGGDGDPGAQFGGGVVSLGSRMRIGVIVFDNQGRHRGLLGRERLIAELRREKFDVALLLQNAFEAAWLAWRAGIRERIGYARDARSWLLTRRAVPKDGETPLHETYYYLELLRRAGWLAQLPDVSALRCSVSRRQRAEGVERLRAAGARDGAPWIAFAPGAAYGSAKCWGPRAICRSGGPADCCRGRRCDTFRHASGKEMAARIVKCDAPSGDKSGRRNRRMVISRRCWGVPFVHWQRCGSHARCRSGRRAGGGNFRSHAIRRARPR